MEVLLKQQPSYESAQSAVSALIAQVLILANTGETERKAVAPQVKSRSVEARMATALWQVKAMGTLTIAKVYSHSENSSTESCRRVDLTRQTAQP